MHDQPRRRLLTALVFALLAGAFVAYVRPVDRIKADFHADAKGFVNSLEYVLHRAEG